jgi:hypothetical protein
MIKNLHFSGCKGSINRIICKDYKGFKTDGGAFLKVMDLPDDDFLGKYLVPYFNS